MGALWGIIACHHTEPGLLPVDSWSLIREIGAALMLRHDQQERTDVSDAVSELRRIESRFAAALRANGDVHSGSIRLDTSRREGSRFVVTIPQAA